MFFKQSRCWKQFTKPIYKKSVDNVLHTKTNLNEWVTVKANVKEDFKKFHNLDVNELDGIAIMSDTDNSKKNQLLTIKISIFLLNKFY